jgi:hypothetical protein
LTTCLTHDVEEALNKGLTASLLTLDVKGAFKELLQVYRNWRRNTQAETPRPQAGAFPTITPTLNGQTKDGETKPPKPCLCQEIHRWETCPYMFSWNRSPDWKGDKNIQEKVDAQMKSNGMKRHVQISAV